MGNLDETAWMYVLVSDKGKITKNDSGYILVVNRKDFSNLLMFSDRPARLTKHITAEELDKTWKLGNNSFKNDPPNAAVVISGETQTVQLAGMTVTKDHIEFSLKQDGSTGIQTAAEGQTVIFIDLYFNEHG